MKIKDILYSDKKNHNDFSIAKPDVLHKKIFCDDCFYRKNCLASKVYKVIHYNNTMCMDFKKPDDSIQNKIYNETASC